MKPSLSPGGRVCVRDYARGDLAQGRLSNTRQPQRLGQEGFYARWDGTRAYYFTEASAWGLLRGAFQLWVCELGSKARDA